LYLCLAKGNLSLATLNIFTFPIKCSTPILLDDNCWFSFFCNSVRPGAIACKKRALCAIADSEAGG
ncbi:MAG: hypothetical protein ACREPR_23350, partial [Brasilonema sp.]